MYEYLRTLNKDELNWNLK